MDHLVKQKQATNIIVKEKERKRGERERKRRRKRRSISEVIGFGDLFRTVVVAVVVVVVEQEKERTQWFTLRHRVAPRDRRKTLGK